MELTRASGLYPSANPSNCDKNRDREIVGTRALPQIFELRVMVPVLILPNIKMQLNLVCSSLQRNAESGPADK
jgi:hypothetical protein